MEIKSTIQAVIAGAVLLVGTGVAHAGVPLNNVEGVGGIAFNPLAYTAGTAFDDTEKGTGIGALKGAINKPQFGVWRIRLNDVKADWNTQSVATTVFDRLELSYGNETIAQTGAPKTINKQNIGVKGLLVKENAGDTKWVPAIAVGAIHKETTYDTPADVKKQGYDFYAVATKLVTQYSRPVLLSAGVRSTDARSTGVYGFGTKRDLVGFGNIDVILPLNLAVGVEYEQGAQVTGWKNADYYDAHLAWLANKNLTLVAAYVNTGDWKQNGVVDHKIGLGNGFVLSANYAF